MGQGGSRGSGFVRWAVAPRKKLLPRRCQSAVGRIRIGEGYGRAFGEARAKAARCILGFGKRSGRGRWPNEFANRTPLSCPDRDDAVSLARWTGSTGAVVMDAPGMCSPRENACSGREGCAWRLFCLTHGMGSHLGLRTALTTLPWGGDHGLGNEGNRAFLDAGSCAASASRRSEMNQ